VSARDALAHAGEHCFERHSSVAAKELLSEALRFGVGAFGVADAWRNLEKDGRFSADVDGRLVVASREVLAEERRMVKLAAEGRAGVPALNLTCEPTAHRFVWKVFPPPPHHSPEGVREPTATARFGVG
jgi:hypothetical protein